LKADSSWIFYLPCLLTSSSQYSWTPQLPKTSNCWLFSN
jgi:hypothetical protein